MLDARRKYALLLAQSLAFRMILNLPDPEALARVITATSDAFPREDPLHDMVRSIARSWPDLRGSAEALNARGQALLKQVERATWPVADLRQAVGA